MELTGDALDLAVAKIEYTNPVTIGSSTLMVFKGVPFDYHPSIDWEWGGPIIEREKISVWARGDEWAAESFVPNKQGREEIGATPLIAAMRCYVASKLGDEILD